MNSKWNHYYPGSIGLRYGTLGDLLPTIGQIVEYRFSDASSAPEESQLKISPQGRITPGEV